MDEPVEMSHSAQIIAEIEASGLAPIKQLAFWSGLHENTVTDYRNGRIRFFGAEMRFWNGVLAGLLRQYSPVIPPIVFRITGLLLKNTPLCVTAESGPERRGDTTANRLRIFARLTEDLAAVMRSAAEIYENGRVGPEDNPTIAELTSKVDDAVAQLLGIKYSIARERQEAAVR